MAELPEFLRDAFKGGQDIPVDDLSKRLLLSLVMGCVVALVYRLTHRSESPPAPSFIATLVLLCVIIAVVTQVVGESVGRAFTLVGALSIVRFRTIVEDTRDTAFVIFAVVVGMAAGMGNLPVAVVGLSVVSLAAVVMFAIVLGLGNGTHNPRVALACGGVILLGAIAVVVGMTSDTIDMLAALLSLSVVIMAAIGLCWLQRDTPVLQLEWTLLVRVSTGAGVESPWETVFTKHCDYAQMQSTATARQGAAVDLTYKIRLKAGVAPLQLLNELNRLEGIQNLELKRI